MGCEVNGKTIETPELDKLRSVKDESQKIGNFIEWLHENKFEIREWKNGRHFSIAGSIESLLARYYEIDLAKVDKEKQAILDQLAASNG